MKLSNAYKQAYDRAFEILMECEGIYSNDPADKGGATKYGFSKAFHPEIDFNNFTIEDAKKKAYEDYWTPCGNRKIWDLVDKSDRYALSALCERLFNFSFNMGIKQATILLQNSCRAVIHNKPILESDGILGKLTLKKIEDILRAGLVHHLICVYKNEAANFYRRICIGNQEKFLQGLLNRAYRTYYRTGVL